MDRVLTNWQEVLYYDAIFASITNDSLDDLEGKKAVAFLRKSQLPTEDIKAVRMCRNRFYVDLYRCCSNQVSSNKPQRFSTYS